MSRVNEGKEGNRWVDVDPPRVPLVVHIGDMIERRGLESNET